MLLYVLIDVWGWCVGWYGCECVWVGLSGHGWVSVYAYSVYCSRAVVYGVVIALQVSECT